MANADSGPRSPSRFFSYRWAYQFLAYFLWFNLGFVCFVCGELAGFAPAYLIWNLISGSYPGIEGLAMQGVLGFDFGYDGWNNTLPTLATIALLIGAIALFIAPQSNSAKYLPAMRGLHLRAKLSIAFVTGVTATALLAAMLDILHINLLPLFDQTGLMPTHGWTYSWRYKPTDYSPSSGIISLVSLGSLFISIIGAGTITFGVMSFATLGRDRYWQSERWTLLLTLCGIFLILVSGLFLRDDYFDYRNNEQFLGGCYTAWICGWLVLTYAWTCRTMLLMMMMKYEQAAVDADQPICFACGYDLRMLESDRCPECGTSVHPVVLKKMKARA